MFPLRRLGSTFHGQILHQLFGLGLDLFRGVLRSFLNLLRLGLVLLLLVVDHRGGVRRRKHVLQHVVEPVDRLQAVLLEPVQPERPDRRGEAKHGRVDPRRPGRDRFARLVRHAAVRDLLNDALQFTRERERENPDSFLIRALASQIATSGAITTNTDNSP